MRKRKSWPLNFDEYPFTEERLTQYYKAFRRFRVKMPNGLDRSFTLGDLEQAVEQVSNFITAVQTTDLKIWDNAVGGGLLE